MLIADAALEYLGIEMGNETSGALWIYSLVHFCGKMHEIQMNAAFALRKETTPQRRDARVKWRKASTADYWSAKLKNKDKQGLISKTDELLQVTTTISIPEQLHGGPDQHSKAKGRSFGRVLFWWEHGSNATVDPHLALILD